jgi:protein-S-isoprenylcysteine O-methyltransferase Ste14
MTRSSAALATAMFLCLAPGTVAGIIPWWISGWKVQTPFFGLAPIRIVGVLLIAAGLPVLIDSSGRFALEGLGTPAPVLPTQHLVIKGFYRYVRNPMYVAVVWVILGQAILFGNVTLLAYAALVALAFHLFVLGYEEPTLRKSYGAEYDAFCSRVPRGMPRL